MNEFQASVTLAKLKGEKGDSAHEYFLEANEVEVLKFYLEKGGQASYSLSPSTLNLYLYKSARELLKIDKRNLTVKIDSQKDNLTSNGPEGFITDGENNDYLVINFDIIKNLLSEDSGLITFQYTYDDRELQLFLPYRYGVNLDMAKLNICADGIYQSVANSKLKFTSEGLELVNGGLTISKISRDENGEPIEKDIFYFDKETGNLYIEGNGSFSGEINAATGFFGGKIEAGSGKIGGFFISQDELYSAVEEGETSEDASIRLMGADGKIIANNIELGVGAKITEYLQLGDNVKIYNPEKSIQGNFIEVKKIVVGEEGSESTEQTIFQINQAGQLILSEGDNQIVMDGSDGTIQGGGISDFAGWKLSPNESYLNNVTIRGSIKASVIEYGEVESVGGIILVRPSGRIKNIETSTNDEGQVETEVEIESSNGFDVGDYCLIQRQIGESKDQIWGILKTKNENYVNKFKIEILNGQTLSEETIGSPIVSFGDPSGQSKNNIGLALNGSNNDSLVKPNSLSIFEYTTKNGDDGTFHDIDTKILLGKIPQDNRFGDIAGSYGLYAENVWIKGSLIAEGSIGAQNYAGITSGRKEAPMSGLNQKVSDALEEGLFNGKWVSSEILIWAGAASNNKVDIENSNFYIDKNGNMYASSGYFSGAIISDSIIRAAEIQTATLTGINEKEGEPALKIQDVAKGIHFYQENKAIFELNKDKIVSNISNIVFNNGFKVEENGKLLVPYLFVNGGINNITGLAIDNNQIYYTDSKILEYPSYENSGSSIYFDDEKIQLKIGLNDNLTVTELQSNFNKETKFNTTVKMGEKMEYKKVEKIILIQEEGKMNQTEVRKELGYDLFVMD